MEPKTIKNAQVTQHDGRDVVTIAMDGDLYDLTKAQAEDLFRQLRSAINLDLAGQTP